jgi:hypothetical protein
MKAGSAKTKENTADVTARGRLSAAMLLDEPQRVAWLAHFRL